MIIDDEAHTLLTNEQYLAEKYPHNTTIVHMDKEY
jgi:hypothetical protein